MACIEALIHPEILFHRVEKLPYDKLTWKDIAQQNLYLSPDTLGVLFPEFQNFTQISDHFIWSRNGEINPVENESVFGFYAPTAGGKDTLLEGISIPKNRIITTTTRPLRNEEIGLYYFTSEKTFFEGIRNEEFLEWMKQENGHYYGTPKKQTLNKIAQHKLTIWRGNLQGHITIEKSMKALGKNMVGIFVLPGMTYQEYEDHVYNVRSDAGKRWKTALSEIQNAPRADYLILNQFGEKNTTIQDVNFLFKELTSPKE